MVSSTANRPARRRGSIRNKKSSWRAHLVPCVKGRGRRSWLRFAVTGGGLVAVSSPAISLSAAQSGTTTFRWPRMSTTSRWRSRVMSRLTVSLVNPRQSAISDRVRGSENCAKLKRSLLAQAKPAARSAADRKKLATRSSVLLNPMQQLALHFSLFFLLGFAQPASAVITSKKERTSKIPSIYQRFLPGIGSLVVGRGAYTCTAFCIASDVIATSQHCLQSANERWRSSSLNFRFSVESKGSVRRAQILGVTTAERKVNIAYGLKKTGSIASVATKRSRRRFEADWALIKLRRNICDTVLAVEPLIGLSSRTSSGRQYAAMISAEHFNRRVRARRWTYSGACQFVSAPISLGEGAVAHNCESVPGTSGSPILLRDDDGQLVVVAVNSSLMVYKDPETRKMARLNSAASSTSFADSIPHFLAHERFSEPEKLREIQGSLKDLNYLRGKVDGKFGPDTRLAIVLFEHSKGLPELGLPSSLIYGLLTGKQVMPRDCWRSTLGWRRILPLACKRFGLDAGHQLLGIDRLDGGRRH